MTGILSATLVVLLVGANSSAPAVEGQDEAAVRQAALDYIEGWFEGDAARLEPVLHPNFVKRIAAVTVAGDDFFLPEDRDGMLARARAGGDKATPQDKREIRVRVLDLARTTAAVRVDSTYYVEYLSLVRLRGHWQVVNVLWENVPNDKTAIPLAPEALAPYAGEYRSAKGRAIQIAVEGSRIFLLWPGEPRIEVFPESESEFFTKGYKSGLRFVRDPAGGVLQMVYHANYRSVAFERVRSPETSPPK